jgi:hypothetical protein
MEAVTLDNKLTIEDFTIYGIIKESYMVLFEPFKNEFIAQIQYPGIMEVSTDQFIIYKTGTKIPGYEWSRIFEEEMSPLIPQVNFEKGFLLTATHSDVLLFDIKNSKEDAEPNITFPLPSQSGNVFVSSSKEGILYFGYSEKDKVILKCYNQEGKELFEVQSQEEFMNFNKVIAPPILVKDNIYLLTNNKLICINNKNIMWTVQSDGIPFSYATGLADNSILTAQTSRIINYGPDGEKKFSFEVRDTVSAPPIIDKNGSVYFCSKTAIFSLK